MMKTILQFQTSFWLRWDGFSLPKKRIIAGIFFLGLFALNLFVISRTAFYDFALSDWGTYLDVDWRVLQGQKLYVDFDFHTGPIQIYLDVLFFKLFGFGKNAILLHLAFINASVAFLTAVLCWRRVPLILNIFCIFFSLTGFYWIRAYPYYDYTAHFFGLAAVTAIALAYPSKEKRQDLKIVVVSAVLTVLSLLTKINIGFAYGVIFTAVFLTGPRKIINLAVFFLAGIVSSILITFFLTEPFVFLQNILRYNALVSDARLLRFLLLPVFLKNFFWLPFMLLPIVAIDRFREWKVPLVLCLGVGAVAIFTVNTGSYRGWDYLPVMGVYMALSFRFLYSIYMTESASFRRKIMALFSIATLVFTGTIQMRQLMRPILMTYHITQNTSAPDYYQLKNGPFRGWIFPKDRGEVLDSMIEAVQKIPATENLLILSDMQMIYLFAKKESYRGIPVQWYVGIAPPPWKVEQTRNYLYTHVADWVLTRKDGGIYPINEIMSYLGIPAEFLTDGYDLIGAWESNALFRRRTL